MQKYTIMELIIKYIILTVKMIEAEGHHFHDSVIIDALDLDFSKSRKAKAEAKHVLGTERGNAAQISHNQGIKTDRSSLRDRKKSYSDAIRQRNLNALARRKKSEINCTQMTNQATENKCLLQLKENIITEVFQQMKKQETKKKSYKSAQNKMLKKSISVLDIEPIPTLSQRSHNQLSTRSPVKISGSSVRARGKAQGQKTKARREMALCSNEVAETIIVYDSDATVLKKQNNTFKKQLSNFRKENSSLRKQLSDARIHIEELSEKAKQMLEAPSHIAGPSHTHELQITEDNSNEIIQRLRAEVTHLKKANCELELRTYMTQKRLVEQLAFCKKKMAKQLSEWREKCAHLRAENMKYKTKSYRDLTISMEISQDQQ